MVDGERKGPGRGEEGRIVEKWISNVGEGLKAALREALADSKCRGKESYPFVSALSTLLQAHRTLFLLPAGGFPNQEMGTCFRTREGSHAQV